MAWNMVKRSLIVGITFLFLSTASLSVLASTGKTDLNVSSSQARVVHCLNDNDTFVAFCAGRISNVETIIANYGIVGYRFFAINVICSTSIHDKPLFHQVHDKELVITPTYFGIFDNDLFNVNFCFVFSLCGPFSNN